MTKFNYPLSSVHLTKVVPIKSATLVAQLTPVLYIKPKLRKSKNLDMVATDVNMYLQDSKPS